MNRGDLVPVVQPGTYGKPRPALIIQSDLFNNHPSVTILPLTSDLRDTPLFRLRIEPSEKNGLLVTSEVMIDKITSVPREKTRAAFGIIEDKHLKEAERLLALWIGIA